MKKFFYIVMVTLFIIFICIYSASSSSYYEFSNNKRTVFTEEKIQMFEKDVAEGKNIDINNYLDYNSKDYSNKITRIGDSISEFIYKSVNFILKGSFKIIEKLIK